MGTEILQPQDCLARQSANLFSRRSLNPNASHKLFRKAPSLEGRWRRDGSSRQAKPPQQRKQLVMGQVRILKRLEPADGTADRKEERVGAAGDCPRNAAMFGTRRLGPEKIPVVPYLHDAGASENGYAGSAFSVSPPPNSLPLPSFSTGESADSTFERSATAVLRRLLGLE